MNESVSASIPAQEAIAIRRTALALIIQDHSGLLPSLFSLNVGSFYMQLASELDRRRVLQIVRENLHLPRRVIRLRIAAFAFSQFPPETPFEIECAGPEN